MYNSILIRYGEIFLKGHNRNKFEAQLIKNIKLALKPFEYNFIKAQSRYFVENFSESDYNDILSALKKVFGIHSISPCYKLATNLSDIAVKAALICPKEGVFRVSVNRADNKIKTRSMDIAAEIGGYLLSQSPQLTVNLFNFDFELNVDIRENGFSYLFFERIICENGLPVGCSGNGMLLLSGGIDSPVAGLKMAKRGMNLFAIHYHSFPYTSELALQKVKDLAGILSSYVGEIKLLVVPFTEIQYAIHNDCREDFMITIMRRFMMRVAEHFAIENNCGAIITGESLGQVASQTVESINATNAVVTLPVFRPLIGNDKEEIIAISKKMGAYDISIRPYEDCCTVFLPKNPIIKPKMNVVLEEEQKLNITALIENAIAKTEVVIIS